MTPEILGSARGHARADDGERDVRRARPAHGIPRQPDGHDRSRASARPCRGCPCRTGSQPYGRRRAPTRCSGSRSPGRRRGARADARRRRASTTCSASPRGSSARSSARSRASRGCGISARATRRPPRGWRRRRSTATGRIAACYGEMGPGAHNLVGGLGTARANGLAVLVLTSGAPTHLGYAASGLAMAADVPGLMRATTKWSAVARSPERIPELVRAAVREALSGRPGPGAPRAPRRRARGGRGDRRSRARRAGRRVARAAPGRRATSRRRRACSARRSGPCSSREAASSSPERPRSCARSARASARRRPRPRWASASSRPAIRASSATAG